MPRQQTPAPPPLPLHRQLPESPDRKMLQLLGSSTPALRGGQALYPALVRLAPNLRQVRAYGFGSHCSDNDPGGWVRGAGMSASSSAPMPCPRSPCWRADREGFGCLNRPERSSLVPAAEILEREKQKHLKWVVGLGAAVCPVVRLLAAAGCCKWHQQHDRQWERPRPAAACRQV